MATGDERDRLAAMRRRLAARPNAVRFGELRVLLIAHGFAVRSGRGSHVVFERGEQRLTIPYRPGTVLAVYVRRALALCEEDR